ncbi:MAG: tetraacyldisaccharide 4'-kinase [Lactobacillales bacterium]|nr:tetraacyldisaccharide 4'-kinase [Lactobacillales bacterium]
MAKVLRPLSHIYAWSVGRRFKLVSPYQASIPVICVGNISVGGTGKTPVCLTLADMFRKHGQGFFFLNHGYKARLKSVFVDGNVHTALDVGDEALLLAEKAPTVVDNHRARGAQLAEKKGAPCLIMDDGFQNPSLIKTFSFVVVDGRKGFGNEEVLPAGPLREPALRGLKRADAVIISGADEWGVQDFLNRNRIDLPVFKGKFILYEKPLQALRGQKVMAFAGLGDPEKFFASLDGKGIDVARKQVFPDHYFYTRFDIERLIHEAGGMPLVTTKKDAVKIPKDLQKKIHIVDGGFVFESEEEVWSAIEGALVNDFDD